MQTTYQTTRRHTSHTPQHFIMFLRHEYKCQRWKEVGIVTCYVGR